MRVQDIMTRQLETCRADDSLWLAARKMWEHDIGALPVVGSDGRVTSVVTDRDVAMAAYLRGKPLGEVKVSEAMSRRLVTVQPADPIRIAEDRMRSEQVHRIPVVNELGSLQGMVTVNDLAHHLRTLASRDGLEPAEIAGTLAAISSPRTGPSGCALP
ncbi:MAG TPA: CBS domain-containing protein [Myxococcaceae bacterium]|nr:CBS domain-containing protein [Myxococcaceae bacterium]